jgi:hypothetical protein
MKKKYNMNDNGWLVDAYAEYTSYIDTDTKEEKIKMDMHKGESEIFEAILQEGSKIKCRIISNFDEVKKAEKKRGNDLPLIEIHGFPESPKAQPGILVYRRPNNDCFLTYALEEHRMAVVVYKGLKHKVQGLMASLCFNFLDADINAFLGIFT